MLTRRSLLAGAGALAVSSVQGARGQSGYPNGPIKMLVGYPAGGGVDIVARLLGESIQNELGATIVVENRTGALATIAAGAAAKAPPDGQTLLMAASGEISVNQHLYKDKLSYNALRDLVPVALVGIVPNVIVVGANLPIKSPADLVSYAKANSGKLSYSTGGVGGPQHLAGELMNKMAGIDVLHVPYRGSAPAVTDVATGAVTMSISSLAVALPLMDDGKIRAIAVTSKERMPQLPDVTPLREGAPGLADYELLNWFAMFAPTGTPTPILERLNAISNKALTGDGLSNKLKSQGIVPKPMSLAELKDFVQSETTKFGSIISDANIKLGN